MYGKTLAGFKAFYESSIKGTHPNPWLIDLWGADPSRFETQILCHNNGEPVEGTKKYTDKETGEMWGPIRWPLNAYDNPEPYDPILTFMIDKRVKGIGTTWWDWKNKQSVRLGFDIDSVIGHAAGVGVDEATIRKFDTIDVPYLTVLRSTRGLGRHIYIEFKDPYPITENHHEHAAIARAFLRKLSRDTGINFEAEKDVCGGVMWIYHTNTTAENRGYQMLKPATEQLTALDVPANWRDHLPVVKGSRSRVLVRGYTPNGETKGDELDDMSNVKIQVPLEPAHEQVLSALEDTGFSTMWVDDHHLCQTHTQALKDVHKRLSLRGLFDTTAPGDDPGKPNCFMRPRLNGGWDVYRFGQGTAEHELWDKVGEWTHIGYNVDPSFDKLMAVSGGTLHIDPSNGYSFSTKATFQNALALMGVTLTLPSRTGDDRALSIRRRPEDGKPIICIEKKRDDKPVDFEGFVKTSKGWQKVVDPTVKIEENTYLEELMSSIDNEIRALKQRNFNDNESRGGTFIGWVYKDSSGGWVDSPGENITMILRRQKYPDLDVLKGDALYNCWLMVNEPFKPEFPGGRKWNRDAPQLRFAPAKLGIDELPKHEWWDKYLNHLGTDLDEYIKELDWCEEWNIRTGGDYLKVWIACMIRYPFDKLPYLFMWGSQETGKSMFYESIQLLMTKGVVSADKALTSEGGYNGELLNCVLAYIDETNVAAAGREVYSRLKAWTTGLTITIHPKYQQVFEAVNTCHFVQLANELEALPVFRGDKRITAIQVPPVIEPIPKDVFMRNLEEEAPHFLYTLMNWDIPDARSRLRLPVIETASKTNAIELNESVLHNFIADRCYEVPGTKIKLDEFYQHFLDSLSEAEKSQWNKRLVKKELTDHFLIGRGPGNVDYIGNLTFTPDLPEGIPYTLNNRRLVQKGQDDSSENE